MRTALVLLFLFALASVPGSLVPQRGVSDPMVAQRFAADPELARWLDRLWLFDVFKAPWFAAVYLLLFVSLIGCLVPRALAHAKELRRKPPPAPRNLGRLPHHAELAAEADLAGAVKLLRRRRFRVVEGPGWLAAEKGRAGETGNLIFHLSLVGLLIAFGLGGTYGYRGNVLLVEGNQFANTVSGFDRYIPGTRVGGLEPFTITLDRFEVSYIAQGDKRGQATDYAARLKVTDRPGAAPRDFTLKVNEPLDVNGTMTYLLGNGYAPVFKVLDGRGQVAFDGPVPCLVEQLRTFTSGCVIKVPDARPTQLGILARFLPTELNGVSVFPGAANPVVQVYAAFTGDLGMGSGRPQSVYQLTADRLKPVLMGSVRPLAPGERLALPGGVGSVQFTGLRKWITLQIAYDPFRPLALASAVAATLGLTLSLTVRRRRIWVRGAEVGGLTRTGGANFPAEFAGIVKELHP